MAIFSATGCTLSARHAPGRRVKCADGRATDWNEIDGYSATAVEESTWSDRIIERPVIAVKSTSEALRRSLILNLVAAVSGLQIFFDPPGSAIRPMGLPLFISGLEIVSIIVVLPHAAKAILRERQLLKGLVAAILALTPGILCAAVAMLIVVSFEYRLKP